MKQKIMRIISLVLVCLTLIGAAQSATAISIDDITWKLMFGMTKWEALNMLIKEFGGDISNLATAMTTMTPEEITVLLQRFDIDATDLSKLLKEQDVGLDIRNVLDVISQGGYTGVYDYGDLDGDKKVTAADARLVLRYSVKLDNFTKEMLEAADVNDNGQVTSEDARLIMRYAVGLEDRFAAANKQPYEYDD